MDKSIIGLSGESMTGLEGTKKTDLWISDVYKLHIYKIYINCIYIDKL